ncbi:hypothetical protein OSTOST_16016 [Ostertagia ostertagi]
MQMEGLRKLQHLRYVPRNGIVLPHSIELQGFFGLWLGWIPNCQRAALLNMADIATYDYVKHKLLGDYELPGSCAAVSMYRSTMAA